MIATDGICGSEAPGLNAHMNVGSPTKPLQSSNSWKSDNEEETVGPAQKRRRLTNNSFVTDLDNNLDESVTIPLPPLPPLPPSPFQFHVHVSKGTYVGVWKHSPGNLVSKKHAVFAFIDKGDKMRSRVHPETKNGEALRIGFPVGPGKSMIKPEEIIYEPHLLPLTHLERKEYVRIRTEAIENGESAADRQSGENQAVSEILKQAQENEVSRDKPATTTNPESMTKPANRNRLSGYLIGYWKDSPVLSVQDKHACYAIAQEDNRLRVRVAKETRDGRPIADSSAHGAHWIAFDECILEPHLVTISRMEVKEYVRIMQQKDLEGMTDNERLLAENKALAMANAKVIWDTGAEDDDGLMRMNAKNEKRRKMHNQNRLAAKARPESYTISQSPRFDSHRTSQPTAKKRDDDAEGKESSKDLSIYTREWEIKSTSRNYANRQVDGPSPTSRTKSHVSGPIKNSSPPQSDNDSTPSSQVYPSIENPFTTSKKRSDNSSSTNINVSDAPIVSNPRPKARAIRSSQAEHDARVERFASGKAHQIRDMQYDPDGRDARSAAGQGDDKIRQGILRKELQAQLEASSASTIANWAKVNNGGLNERSHKSNPHKHTENRPAGVSNTSKVLGTPSALTNTFNCTAAGLPEVLKISETAVPPTSNTKSHQTLEKGLPNVFETFRFEHRPGQLPKSSETQGQPLFETDSLKLLEHSPTEEVPMSLDISATLLSERKSNKSVENSWAKDVSKRSKTSSTTPAKTAFHIPPHNLMAASVLNISKMSDKLSFDKEFQKPHNLAENGSATEIPSSKILDTHSPEMEFEKSQNPRAKKPVDVCESSVNSDTPDCDVSESIKIINGVRYDRKITEPYAGMLVGDKREMRIVDGQDYVEYRILVKVLSDSIKIVDGVVYEKKTTELFVGKLVSDKRKLLSIDDEQYFEYRLLSKLY